MSVELGRVVRRRAAYACTVTTRYVALLRGVNVGTHNRVAMIDLRRVMTGLGFQDVRTYLQSGNIVFAGPDAPNESVERAIGERITAELGMSVAVLVRTGGEMRDVVARNPLPTDDPARLVVLFLSAPPDPARVAEIAPERYAPERFAVLPGRIYLYCANGILESELTKVFSDRRLGCAVTARNWNTVAKVAELLDR
jgi:uncharacterized protein (DUF1697 family)